MCHQHIEDPCTMRVHNFYIKEKVVSRFVLPSLDDDCWRVDDIYLNALAGFESGPLQEGLSLNNGFGRAVCMQLCVCIHRQIHINPPECDQQSKAAGSKPTAGMPGQRRSPAQQFCNTNTHTHIIWNPLGTTWSSAVPSRAINIMQSIYIKEIDGGLYNSILYVLCNAVL